MQYVYWLGIGVVVGWICGKRIKGKGHRVWISILLGMLGALMGGLAMRGLGYSSAESEIYIIIFVVLGAAFMTVIVGIMTGRGRYAGAP